MCIIGHNEHVEAIVDPTSKPSAECSSCTTKEKLMEQLLLKMEIISEKMKAKGIIILLI